MKCFHRCWVWCCNFKRSLICGFAAAAAGVVLAWLNACGSACEWALPYLNYGFLFVGFLIPTVFQVFAYEQNRCHIAHAIHMEIVERLARCCGDYLDPWRVLRFGATSQEALDQIKKMDIFRLRKFVPISPIIYPALASKLPMLESRQAQKASHFYFRLEQLRRDVENLASEADSEANNNPAWWQSEKTVGRLKLIALRFYQTLGPGRAASEAFGSAVVDAEETERVAFEEILQTASAKCLKLAHEKTKLRDAIELIEPDYDGNGEPQNNDKPLLAPQQSSSPE